ncbi:MAG: RNA-directed DNA polymerase, partial [Eubacteriales bacterium]|nr:RNA-directed DNA polymerase [Eubacteriales bacterium]
MHRMTLLAWSGKARIPDFMVRTEQPENSLDNNAVRHTEKMYRGLANMNSRERHEARYKRRIAKRQARRDEYSRRFGSYEEVFSYEHLYEAAKNCCKGVMWKNSTQSYVARKVSNVAKTYDALTDRTFRSRGFHEFDIIERGKPRHIKSVHIAERVVQRCLCDNILVPVFEHSFIYDNAASLKGKGIDFSMDRLDAHLHQFYRKHGAEALKHAYVLTGDFSDFFNSAPHDTIYKESRRRIHDPNVQRLACQFMEDFGEKGFGLGSQVSQIDALMVGSPLDHYIKEELRVKYYGRYMDDFYLIHESKDYLRKCLEKIRQKCAELGLVLNRKKTGIAPLSGGVKFLKTKFFLTDTGAV